MLQSHHHPDFDEPTTGAVAQGALHVIANSYVGHFQLDGRVKNEDQLKGTVIVGVTLTQCGLQISGERNDACAP